MFTGELVLTVCAFLVGLIIGLGAHAWRKADSDEDDRLEEPPPAPRMPEYRWYPEPGSYDPPGETLADDPWTDDQWTDQLAAMREELAQEEDPWADWPTEASAPLEDLPEQTRDDWAADLRRIVAEHQLTPTPMSLWQPYQETAGWTITDTGSFIPPPDLSDSLVGAIPALRADWQPPAPPPRPVTRQQTTRRQTRRQRKANK